MSNHSFSLGVIRESREDEFRAPLSPQNIKKLKETYKDLQIIVQPSTNRCFSDTEYTKVGATLSEDLSKTSLILGVKEIDVNILIQNKKYLFFSHTSKIQPDNYAATQGTPEVDKKKLLKNILKKKITLIDYENIRDKNNARYLGFGRFAGIVGCYNSLSLYEQFTNNINLPRAYELKEYSLIKEILKNKKFSPIKVLITGDGRVAKGVLELLKCTNFVQVSKNDFINKNFNEPIFCNLETKDYVSEINKNAFNLKDFINNPKNYISIAGEYLKEANMIISAHYWDPLSPKIFELSELEKFKQLKVIGDITCDINGSIPTTLKSTTIQNPYFYLNKNTNKEIDVNKESLAIMAVDNLPSELSRDSSEEFGEGIVKEVLPYIINKDDQRIHSATIIKNGIFLPKYKYLEKYISV